MGYIVSTLLVGLCLYLIVQPFFSKEEKWHTDDIKDDLDDAALEQIYATLNELEMEYNMGKLPQEDYRKLKKQYERIASEKLKEDAYAERGDSGSLEHSGKEESKRADYGSVEDDIERELEELRQKRRGRSDA